ncbi:MAG: putative sugar nucleotidyl transferase, partial [Gemmatimonadaceae bacterium]
MSGLYLYDDFVARAFEPFALTRPTSELRAGVELIRARWESALGTRATGSVVAPHLADFEELGAPPAVITTIPAGSIVANSRCVVPLGWSGQDTDVWMCHGLVAAVRVRAELNVEELEGGEAPLESLGATGNRTVEIDGRWLTEVWSFITDLGAQLRDDISRLAPTLDCISAAHLTVVGSNPVFIERGAAVESMVIVDATAGPVLVRSGASVRAFTRLTGPVAIGKNASVLGDRVAGCSIGEMSVVRGEMSESVLLGHSNKSHDGFVGHSYLGRWVNLGAGTTT